MDLKPPIDRTERLTPTGEIVAGPPPEATQANVRTLGRYQIQEELGRGAMGAVYKAFDPVIARTVALKTILIDSHAPDRAAMIERLKQEAKAAGGLDHPNIITIYDVGEENGAVYLSMQFVQGTTLAKVLEDAGVPPLETLLSWADQILAAVGFAHARGVIHRDLKPANIMVTEQGAIKVLDFGIAKIENTSLTQTGLVVGTPSYMSPEQIAGKKVDHRADIFSLGAVFYELLTREKPFAGDIATILYKIVNEDPVAPSLINPAIPGWIDAVVRKALAKDPKDRFQTCEEMRKAFLEQSARASLTPLASVAVRKALPKQPATAVAARLSLEDEEAPARIWPRLMLALTLVLLAAAGWAFYVRSATGSLPPVVAKLEGGGEQALGLVTGKLNHYADERLQRDADEHSAPPAQNAAAPDAQATTQSAPAAVEPASGAAAPAATPASTAQGAASLQPVAAQSPSDHPAIEGGAAPGATPSSPADISQKVGDSSQSASAQAAPAQAARNPTPEANANNQAAAENTPAHDSSEAPTASRGEEKQNAFSTVPKPPAARKRNQETSVTVDGFSRQDVPDLLRQADSSVARGNYRLARYEYGLVLKLDHNNFRAREGLRRLMVDYTSR